MIAENLVPSRLEDREAEQRRESSSSEVEWPGGMVAAACDARAVYARLLNGKHTDPGCRWQLVPAARRQAWRFSGHLKSVYGASSRRSCLNGVSAAPHNLQSDSGSPAMAIWNVHRNVRR